MRFDTWSKAQKQELDMDYQSRFGGQVRVMKKLYHNGLDPILCDELLNNVSQATYMSLIYSDIKQTEALIERMFLSGLEYDVFMYYDMHLDEHSADIIFFTDHDTVEYTDIRIKHANDMKKLLEMILYMGKAYQNLRKLDEDIELNLSQYNLLLGFDADVRTYDEDGIDYIDYKH